ncbi:hypothetical protein [Streptomyces sp. HC307]|uniref:hypothetical protein n=1 Tax=Streptomyces flavusporus TaxID=3385496 RepID=UPI0039175889
MTGQGEEASDKVVNDAVAFAVAIAEQGGRSTEFARDMVRGVGSYAVVVTTPQ